MEEENSYQGELFEGKESCFALPGYHDTPAKVEDVVNKEDIVPIWLMTQHIQTNFIEGMFLHMFNCKQIWTTELTYGPLKKPITLLHLGGMYSWVI